MPTKIASLGNCVDIELKREFEKTTEALGIGFTAAFTVFMKRFVVDGGFPFDVKIPTPTKE